MNSLYILEIQPLSVISFATIFSQSVGCVFVLFLVSFAVQKLISLIRSRLFIFAFISIVLETCYRFLVVNLANSLTSLIKGRFLVQFCVFCNIL